jgi:choline dehydrogenase-like flavoprotein
MVRHSIIGSYLLSGMLASVASAAAVTKCSATNSTTADYVIVGAGPAGLVLAEELTKNSKASVILLEAGTSGDTNPNVTSKSISHAWHASHQDCQDHTKLGA